ncbi:MAG TPA: polysaccharide deacetylase family protein [Candidatus Acidoferrum sp.]|jgi:peptidoglycan/xylan/chitin deacetylase (PgdA/CDA1 family)|nr:polysaccharide deacetylase family protein [Candidatus Acidoferrum sp.]
MPGDIPAYYSGLAAFRPLFDRGNPILTYHKLGPRPRQVRLKGLYLSRTLFTRQLDELKADGYTGGSLTACAGPRTGKRIVITFDDGYVNVLSNGLEPLATTPFKAIQFLVADLLGKCNEWDVPLGEAPEPMMNQTQVREWLAAGHDIGSHTLTHPFLTQVPPRQAQEEITASRKKLEDLFGRPIEHFCYPYGDWDGTVRDMVRSAGYKTACTTEAGINTAADSPFSLRRFTARYPTRTFKAVWSRLVGRVGQTARSSPP